MNLLSEFLTVDFYPRFRDNLYISVNPFLTCRGVLMRKKTLTVLISIFALALLSSVVFAQATTDTEGAFSGLWKIVKDLLKPLVDMDFQDETNLKILLSMLIFPILGYGLSFVFKGKAKIGWIVAGVLTIMSVIAIPGEVIKGIAYTYATVFVFLLAGIPIVALFLILSALKKGLGNHPFAYHWTSVGVIGLILTNSISTFTSFLNLSNITFLS